MRVRLLVIVISAVALLATGTVQSSAGAVEEVVDYDVGGGAAALQVGAEVQSYELRDLGQKDSIRYTNAAPYVIMGKNGGNASRKIVDQRVSNIARVRAGYVTIKGNRQGTPFAEASTVLAGVTIKGTPITALRTECKWDKFGAPTGKVVVTEAGGETYEPAPNTVVPLPGLGTLTLNEQFITDRFIRTVSGAFVIQRVIYVYGARLHLEQEDVPPTQADVSAEVILGLTSCDPVKLPAVSGLKLTSTPT